MNDPRTRENCYHGVTFVHDGRFAVLAQYDDVGGTDG